jgi:hypothetical protein
MKQIAKTWAGCDANHVNYDRDETHPRATVRTLFGKIPDQHPQPGMKSPFRTPADARCAR